MKMASKVFVALASVAVSAFPQSRDARWLADIDSLVRELSRRHPNPFAYTPRQEFDRIVAAVRADVPRLSDRAIQVRMAEIPACLRDAHTNLPLGNLPHLPAVVRWLDDGIWIVSAPEDHPEWLGTRVVSVGGKPIEAALEAFRRVNALDNDHGLKTPATAMNFMRPDVWHALGVIPSPDALPLGLETPAGGRIEATVVFGPPMAHYALDARRGYNPLWNASSSANYGAMLLGSVRTLYVAYNRCVPDPAKPFGSWADSVIAAFDSNPIDRLIIDLRNNGGGDSGVFDPFLQHLSRRRTRFASGTMLLTIVGANTASAAVELEGRLRYEHGATTIGQPTSGRVGSYGATVPFNLPNSRLEAWVSTKWVELPGRADSWRPRSRTLPALRGRRAFRRCGTRRVFVPIPALLPARSYPSSDGSVRPVRCCSGTRRRGRFSRVRVRSTPWSRTILLLAKRR